MKNSLIITFLLLTLGASAQQLNLSRLDVEKLNGKPCCRKYGIQLMHAGSLCRKGRPVGEAS